MMVVSMLRPKREKEGEERRGGGEGKRRKEGERRGERGEERRGRGRGKGGGLTLPCKMIVGLCQGPTGAKGGGWRFLQQLHPQPTQPLHPVLLGNTPCGRPRLQ